MPAILGVIMSRVSMIGVPFVQREALHLEPAIKVDLFRKSARDQDAIVADIDLYRPGRQCYSDVEQSRW